MASLGNDEFNRRVIDDRRSGDDRRISIYGVVCFVYGFEIPRERSGEERRKLDRRRIEGSHEDD